LGILCIVLIVARFSLIAGCGSKADVDITVSDYMCDDQVFDNRMVKFKPDGTFEYKIVSLANGGTTTGTYKVKGDGLTVVFNESGSFPELSGQTFEFEILYEGKHIVDPDGVNWYRR